MRTLKDAVYGLAVGDALGLPVTQLMSDLLLDQEGLLVMDFSACRVFCDSIFDCVNDYMTLNPQVQISMYQSQRGEGGLSDRIDFLVAGIGGTGNLDQEWNSQYLFSEEAYILISPRYREYPAEITALSPIELKNDIFVSDFLVSETFTHVDLLHRICLSAGFKPRISFFTDDFNTKLHMVDEGKGITVLPHSCLRLAHLLAPTLRAFRIENFDTNRKVALMHRKGRQLSEDALDFWDFVADYYAHR